MCSVECTNLMLHLGHPVDMASRDYVWIIFDKQFVAHSRHQVKNLMALSLQVNVPRWYSKAKKNCSALLYLCGKSKEHSTQPTEPTLQ